MAKATNDLLETLHEAVGTHLLGKIKTGEATASEIAQAVKFLKDNSIDVSDPVGTPIEGLAASLTSRVPFTDPSDPTAH
jgi:hypothetical protein